MRSVGRHARAAVVLVGLGVATACTPGGPTAPTPTTATESGRETSPESVTPSITREVPPEQRQPLATAPPDKLCGLVSAEELAKLAFPVESGQYRTVEFQHPARGCTFDARTGVRSVTVAAQPEGFAHVGINPVRLGQVHGSKTMHVNDCTVFAPAAGATLQVTVTAGEADSDECDTAQGVAEYVLAGVVH